MAFQMCFGFVSLLFDKKIHPAQLSYFCWFERIRQIIFAREIIFNVLFHAFSYILFNILCVWILYHACSRFSAFRCLNFDPLVQLEII